jgi:tRNA threonylcarbamoyladenosine biosynthesis protein TsaE
MNHDYVTSSPEETHLLGKTLAKTLKRGAIVALFGDLGAGKTTLIRGMAEECQVVDAHRVCSPTFTFLNIYTGKIPLYHFDLYRLPSEEEFFKAGFDEYLHSQGICCIEWADKLGSLLPPHAHCVTFTYTGEGTRRIEILYPPLLNSALLEKTEHSKIEACASSEADHSRIGKANEENRFCKAPFCPKVQNSIEGGMPPLL